MKSLASNLNFINFDLKNFEINLIQNSIKIKHNQSFKACWTAQPSAWARTSLISRRAPTHRGWASPCLVFKFFCII